MNIDYSLSAPVFNIQSFCIHDGPGIRSVVFLKGCPLRCYWCANPESQGTAPELLYYESKCTGCGKCAAACPVRAVSLKPPVSKEAGKTDQDPAAVKPLSETDRMRCTACGACETACRNGAREIAGKSRTVREVMEIVSGDVLFYEGTGGGITVSGGEPLMHPGFLLNLLSASHEQGIHTAIESCSFASREIIDRVYPQIDLGLLDVKHMDPEKHLAGTGVRNESILDNIRHISLDLRVPAVIRVPVIPGYNDDRENIRRTAEFAASLRTGTEINLLPYHNLGEGKNTALGHPESLGIKAPDDSVMEEIQEICEKTGIKAKIGG